MSVSRILLRCVLPVSVLVACATTLTTAPRTAHAADGGAIKGVVKNSATGKPMEQMNIVLLCSCMQGDRYTKTNELGAYRFDNLPPGSYTVQVLDPNKQKPVFSRLDLVREATERVDFSYDPEQDARVITVHGPPTPPGGVYKEKIDGTDLPNIPLPDRNMDSVIDLTPTGGDDGAGKTMMGTDASEQSWSVDNAPINDPRFGTVGSSIVQDFLDTVEVQEAGYDAEFGGASGGQIRARRISGSNNVRGVALLRYSPRLAAPRLISATDEALRSAVVTDHEMQAVIQVNGPIIKDKLFFAAGVAPAGNVNTLIQSYYHRVDKDRSGGFADRPYKNGDFDCAEGGNFIQTEKFAEKRFKTGRVNVGWFGRLDWVISPKHRVFLSGGGGPSFDRTTYRLPASSVPNTFGSNPTTALGGAARVATGIVDKHFGWTLGDATQVGLNYEGRAFKDKVEIDAGISFFQATYEEAWKLDHPEQRLRTLTQESDNQGRNLYEFLDRDGAVNTVPGVQDKCNNAELPGLACPTRFWLSGGLGQYNQEVSRRVTGQLNLTHFFDIAQTAHQIKYGTIIEHLERKTVSTYSGSNSEDFYNNCPNPQDEGGGGEYCYDPETGEYDIEFANRVNNNRIILVNTDNPNQRTTIGYGRVRKEQGDLRAIATPIGAGVRAPSYNARLTTQNYGLYLQDKMQLGPGVYLNAGVRWEMQDMRDLNGNRALFIWDNIAPRLSASYDWTQEGKSRLYASYGRFYRQLPLQLNSRVFGGLVNVTRSYRSSDCTGTVNINGTDRPMSEGGQPTEYCGDFNTQTTGLTVGAVVPRLKGQFNEQFQLGYEQEVVEDLLLGVRWAHNTLGRAVEDVSTNGGLNFLIANPGEAVSESDVMAKQAECNALQSQFDGLDPDDEQRDVVGRELNRCNFLADAYDKVGTLFNKPVRNFDAWSLIVRKRLSKNWLLRGTYTYSRLVGNYDGAVDRNTGAINLGASTQYDIPELVRNSYGPLFNNRPHTVRLDGYYTFDLRKNGRLTTGVSFRYLSGTPVSTMADNNRYPGQFLIFVLPRGSGGSMPPLYQANLQVGYTYPISGSTEIEFSARLVNITNAKTPLRVDETYSFQSTRPVAGGDLEDLKHTKIQSPGAPTSFYQRQIVAPQGNYGTSLAFQRPLSAQFELRLRF